jgi:hypothetical protein
MRTANVGSGGEFNAYYPSRPNFENKALFFMQNEFIGEFLKLSSAVGSLSYYGTWVIEQPQQMPRIRGYIETATKSAKKLGFDGIRVQLLTLLTIKDARLFGNQVVGSAQVLWIALAKEVAQRGFLMLEREEVKQYDEKYPFGEEVFNAFPSIRIDIEEAVKCNAVGRYTAAGIHSLRVTEFGVEKIARSANISFFDSRGQPMGWHKLIEGVESKVNAFRPLTSKARLEFKENMSRTLSYLYSIKPMRNALAHPRRHLLKEESAMMVANAGAFMEGLAKLRRQVRLYLK